MARIAIVTGAASSIGQALATRNGRKAGVALTCLPTGCALALRDPGRSPIERPGRDAYRRAARFYDRVFGGLNAGLHGLGLKMSRPMRGWMCWMWVRHGPAAGLLPARRMPGVGHRASPAMLEVARRCLGQRARLRLDDAARLPYPDRAFDLVLASAVLHEMPPRCGPLPWVRMARVLQPGRRLAGQGQPAVAYAMISNATDPPTRRARCTSRLRRTPAGRKPAGALTPTGPGAQNGRIWAALVLTAIQPAATQNGGYLRTGAGRHLMGRVTVTIWYSPIS